MVLSCCILPMKEANFEKCELLAEGVYICKKKPVEAKKKEDLGFLGEVAKAVYITTKPTLSKDEASWVETTFASILVGSIVSGLSIAFGFYIYYLIGSSAIMLVPDPLWNSIVVMIGIIALIALLSFLQYRLTKALSLTTILERFATDDDDEEATPEVAREAEESVEEQIGAQEEEGIESMEE